MRWCRREDVEKQIDQLTTERDELSAENSKLRTALDLIATKTWVVEHRPANEMKQMAREALKGDK